jgi:lysophospholipid acyltransferase (LPLAT)-like uncharacterized protein
MRLRGTPLKLALWIGPILYKLYMKFVFLTSRKSYEGCDPVWDMLERGDNALAVVWHQDAILAPFAFRDRGILTMSSMSADGEILSRVFGQAGFRAVRGSSSRGGKRAVLTLLDRMKREPGSLCGIAADGPRGPAREAKKGIVFLAKHTGAPIFPLRCGARRRILNRSWDQTQLPLPFNELIFRCSEPVSVDAAAGRREIEAARAEVERKLNELTEDIETRFGRGAKRQDG